MIKKKINVLIVVKNTNGGTGTYVEQLLDIKLFTKNEIEISVLVLGKQKYRIFKNTEANFYYFDNENYPEYYKFNIFTLKIFIKEFILIYKLVNSISPKVILSVDTHCNLLTSILKKFSTKKLELILTLHNNLQEVVNKKLSPPLRIILRKLGNYFFKYANNIISPSYELSKHFKDYFLLKKEVLTIPYGINIEKVNILARKKPILPSKIKGTDIIIISLGRFEMQKDFYNIIKAFSNIHIKYKNTKLLLIGDGYEKKNLLNLTKKLKLNRVVFFLGWKQNVFPYLKMSNIFVSSSYYEGFGYAILEAMTQGLPIISTDSLYGPSEILNNGEFGMLTPVGDANKITKCIELLLTDNNQYQKYSKLSLQRIRFYSEKKMLNQYLNIIRYK